MRLSQIRTIVQVKIIAIALFALFLSPPTHALTLQGSIYGCLVYMGQPKMIRTDWLPSQLHTYGKTDCTGSTLKHEIQSISHLMEVVRYNGYSRQSKRVGFKITRPSYGLTATAFISKECRENGNAYYYTPAAAAIVRPWGANGDMQYWETTGRLTPRNTSRFLKCEVQ